MINDDFKKGIEEIQKVRMSKEEKSFILNSLLDKVSNYSPSSRKPSFFGYFVNWQNMYSYGATTLLIFIIVGASFSFVAEASLPGDLLYPLKVNFNESLRGVILLDDTAKVDWEAEKLERRLGEVEALSGKGTIDEKRVEILEKKLDNDLEDFKKTINKIQEKDSKKVSEIEFKLDTKKDAHTKIIEKIQDDKEDEEKEKIESLHKSVNKKFEDKLKEIKKERKDDENRKGDR